MSTPNAGFSFDHPDEHSTAAADELLQQMPEVQQHAIDQHENEIRAAESNAEKDSDGVAFDAAIHTGSKLKSGQWRKRKNAGVAGAVSSPSIVAKSRKAKDSSNVGGDTVQDTGGPSADATATGTAIAATFLAMCQSIGGDEWEPSQQERTFQTEAWIAYCAAKDIRDFPPGLALMIATTSYALPRFAKPKTAAKISRIKTWFALRIAKRKVQKELKKRGIEAVVTINGGELHMNGKPMDPATLQ